MGEVLVSDNLSVSHWACTLSFLLFSMKECLNCSLECNSSNRGITSTLLLQFLKLGAWNEACFARPTGIALLPSAAHFPLCKGITSIHKQNQELSIIHVAIGLCVCVCAIRFKLEERLHA